MIAEVINGACKTWMKDSSNKSTCMWVRQFIGWENICAKQFHACDNSEIATKTETKLRQANVYLNDNKHSKKSRKQYSHKWKHEKWHKCSTRHGKRAYPKTVDLNVSTAPRCDMGCQRCKVDVMNELCNVWLMSFDNIEVVTCMPQI